MRTWLYPIVFRQTGVPGGSVAGDPITLVVQPDGWTVKATIYKFPLIGLTSAYLFTPETTPTVSFDVVGPQHDNSGNLISGSRTIYGTIWRRRSHPYNTSPDERSTGNGVEITFVLNRRIYRSDTQITASFLSGMYTASVASNAKSGVPVKNLSTRIYDVPIGSIITENNLVITPSGDFSIEVTAAHTYAQQGREVACVIATMSDGVHSVVSAPCTTMTKSTRLYSTTGNTVLGSAVVAVADTSRFIVGQALTLPNVAGQPVVASIVPNTSITLTPSSIVRANSTTASGSANVTLSSTAGLFAGMPLSSAQFAGGTTVLSVTDATHFVASNNAAGSSSTDTITFSAVASSTATGVSVTIGNPVPCFKVTFAGGSLTSLTAGQITCDVEWFPFWGDRTLKASLGANGIPVAATMLTSDLHPLVACYDTTGAYDPIYVWVQNGGTATGSTGVSTSATDPGTTNSANYGSIGAGIAAIKTYNNANRGHNDTAAGVVYVRAAGSPWSGFGTSVTAQTSGIALLRIAAAPGETPATVTFQTGAQKTLPAGSFKFERMTITQSDGTLTNQTALSGPDGSNTNPILTEVIFDTCKLVSQRASSAMVNGIGLRSYMNSVGDEQTVGGAALLVPFSISRQTTGIMGGCTWYGSGIWLSNNMGNVSFGSQWFTAANTSVNFIQPASMTFVANKILNAAQPFHSQGFLTANFADVQNIYEKTTVDSQPAKGWHNDGDTVPFDNYVAHHNLVIGERNNEMYNDTDVYAVYKYGSKLYCIDGYGRYNKTDTFDHPTFHQQTGRVGNHEWRHGVEQFGNVIAPNLVDGSRGPSSTAWVGDFLGIGSIYNATLTYYGDNAANTGSNTGNGIYLLGPSSPAYSKVPAGWSVLPFDISGVARPTNGTDSAGPYVGGA